MSRSSQCLADPTCSSSHHGRAGVSLQQMRFLAAWAGSGTPTVMRLANLLLFAHELDVQLDGSEQRGSTAVQTALQERLCRTALCAGSDGGSLRPPVSELCAASAAAALIMRMRGDLQVYNALCAQQGSVLRPLPSAARGLQSLTVIICNLAQALRGLVCDMLLAAQQPAPEILPQLAAALDAWPQALPPAEEEGTARLWDAAADTSGRQHSECGVAAVHAALQALCAGAPTVNVDNLLREDSDSQATEQLAVVCLRHWGHLQWGWDSDAANEAMVGRNQISLGEVFAVLKSLR